MGKRTCSSRLFNSLPSSAVLTRASQHGLEHLAGPRQCCEDTLIEMGYPAWRREGSKETLEPLPVSKGTPRELEKDFGQGPEVTVKG